MAAPRRNIELKASDPDPERSLAVVLGLRARDRGVLRQRDTYFRVSSGRLKLREEEPGTDLFAVLFSSRSPKFSYNQWTYDVLSGASWSAYTIAVSELFRP